MAENPFRQQTIPPRRLPAVLAHHFADALPAFSSLDQEISLDSNPVVMLITNGFAVGLAVSKQPSWHADTLAAILTVDRTYRLYQGECGGSWRSSRNKAKKKRTAIRIEK